MFADLGSWCRNWSTTKQKLEFRNLVFQGFKKSEFVDHREIGNISGYVLKQVIGGLQLLE
ncbi:hypothetical protein SLEP1_g51330 [Rubroshorea leprosula]|uniref:Uncharacterized protein n=1 Tax=Rubroshorea leprosula TaxID=152421 RepID=A0AAV5M5E4_9ROSI|nr:hypothetical protein SLEP1_g51330 [Rubroshorea leprosula]